ncbi:MAG: non-ribosomal peptide synthetase, partial [Candidatus Methylumidiphilus alinenensis]
QLTLPDYMVPSVFVPLESMPLTPNGKIDRKALPAPKFAATAGLNLPATPTEDLLAALWTGVLKRESIGRQDNFFELGGHSLLATKLVARIREAFQVELPIRAVFEHPRLSELAAAIDAATGAVRLPPIERQAADAPRVLSFAQQRLWFLDQFEGQASATYNMPMALRLSGALNVDALRHSLHWLLERHESLRYCFPAQDGQATVRILPMEALEALHVHDLRQLDDFCACLPPFAKACPEFAEWGGQGGFAAETFMIAEGKSPLTPLLQRGELVQALAMAHAVAPFDLARGPLFKADLLLLADNQSVLLLNMHHIASDGWSMGVFIRDWQHAYTAFAQGGQPDLPPLVIQYSDYAFWQRQWLQGEVLQQQVDYWKQKLVGMSELLELPTDQPRPPQQSYQGADYCHSLPATLSLAINQLSKQQSVTVFMTLLAAFKLLLSRYSRQNDICVGSPIANRTHGHTEDLIGFFVNTLVLRSQLDPEQSFIELLQATRQTCLDAYAHQDLPFEMLVDTLKPTRSMSHSPLFQVMFVLQNNETAELELPGLEFGFLETDYPVAKFDLTLSIAVQGGQFHGYWEYATDLFEAKTVERMAAHFEALLDALTSNPQQAIGTVPMLTEGEIRQLQAWNDTKTDYPQDKTIVDLFEAQVGATPDNIAVIFEDQSLTYRQLNTKSNRLARHLLGLAKPDGQPLLTNNPLIAIAVERSLEMVIGLLAILKSGGAYVPIDPSYPAARIRYMLDDSQAGLLLTQSHLTEALALDGLEHDCVVLCLDETDVADQPSENLPARSAACDLTYVIYTSGSTGKPKGVMLENRGAVNLTLFQQRYFQTNTESRILQFASLSFDAATWEVLMSLSGGSRLHLASKDDIQSNLKAVLQRQAITHATLPPSVVNAMSVDDVSELKYLVVAGEACPTELVTKWARQERRVVNAYGPTETTVCASVFQCLPDGNKPAIGQPIANTRIYILNAQQQPQPPGIPGELCIAGDGLARGYLNRPELTAEKFIEAELFGNTERIYKTGDLARWLPDGNLEFLGRIDHQIKLRGFRIELGEIVAVLGQFEHVKEAVVSLYEADGNKRLVAYLTIAEGQSSIVNEPLFIDSLRDGLKAKLPDYMIPASFMILDSLPLTPNGKIDRKALPAPDTLRSHTFSAVVAPRTALELQLLLIWEDVLQVNPISVHDNFFNVGGHSLLATSLIARIERTLGKRLQLRQLFQYGSIAQLAEFWHKSYSSDEWSTLVPLKPSGDKTPLFLVHPGAGTVIWYRHLAHHLSADQPLYGLESQGMEAGQAPFDQVEAMATHYIQAMQTIQPEGPYLIGGWCFGGVVAVEMAQQLLDQGHRVGFLGLLDSYARFEPADTCTNDILLFVNLFKRDVPHLPEFHQTIAHLDEDEQLKRMVESARQAGELSVDFSLDQTKRMLAVFRGHIIAGSRYEPKPYLGKASFFQASEGDAAKREDPTLGWGSIIQGNKELHWIPGDHTGMFVNPNVKILAEKLEDCIAQAMQSHTT